MKIKSLILLGLTLLASATYAGQQIKLSSASQTNFNPVQWTSANTQDYVGIEGPTEGSYFFSVQITASRGDHYPRTGVNVRNCGSITHINPGSTVICMLHTANPLIVFSSDRNDLSASGDFQIL